MRYAVYWAPSPAHPLWRAGCQWLGRDAERPGAGFPQRDAVDEPRRYGFHATLKPPMTLRAGAAPEAFFAQVAALAARTPRFDMPRLAVDWLSSFMALRPAEAIDASHPLRRLADACVGELDAWREPPSEQALQRRLASSRLDEAHEALLRRWGYAHVFDCWRFHMTLSNRLPEDAALRQRWTQDARQHFSAALAQPLPCDTLCVFVEPSPGAPFVLARRFGLASA